MTRRLVGIFMKQSSDYFRRASEVVRPRPRERLCLPRVCQLIQRRIDWMAIQRLRCTVLFRKQEFRRVGFNESVASARREPFLRDKIPK